MKIANYAIIATINRLSEYANKKLPQKISYAITKNLSNLNKEYQLYDEQLKKILNTYSKFFVLDSDGNPVLNNGAPEVEETVRGEYYAQINELLSIETDVDMYYVDPSIFDYEDSERFDAMTPKDIMILQSILCKDEEEKKNKEGE